MPVSPMASDVGLELKRRGSIFEGEGGLRGGVAIIIEKGCRGGRDIAKIRGGLIK